MEEKQFSLKESELQLINSLQAAYLQNQSMCISFIAAERLAYPVSENTVFRIENGTLFIREDKPEDKVGVA